MEGDFRIADWLVQPLRDVIESPEQSVQLEPKAMDLLAYLAEHPGEVIPKERLIRAVWPDAFVTDEVLTNNIWKLRQAFGDDPKDPKIIQTVPRRGYRLIAEVAWEKTTEESSRYELQKKLGRGAMGEVHLAKDMHLGRQVAVKFLPNEMEEDESLRRRLFREARAAAGLDQPFICKVYDTGKMDGRTFIAMEYVEGQTLEDRLKKRPLTVEEALRIVAETAEALQAAHDKYIVHRDVKPSNLMLTEQRHVKVMDFGVAKKLHSAKEDDQEWTSTLTTDASSMGTLPYMSPEQVRGQAVDTRSDIFSLGVVLYEMLTGVHPFRRPLSADTAAATLSEEPPALSRFRKGLPKGLQGLVGRMLAKDREDRYQSIGDVLESLDQLDSRKLSILAIETLKKHWKSISLGTVALAAVVAIMASVFWSPSNTDLSQSPSLPVPLTSYPGAEKHPALSPDGSMVAFSWIGEGEEQSDIWVQVVGTTKPDRKTTDPAWETFPTWSPDGTHIAFFRGEPGVGRGIYMVPVLGGTETRLGSCSFEIDVVGGGGLSWSPSPTDPQFAFPHRNSPEEPNSIYLLSLNSREKEKLTDPPPGVGDMWPAFSPDGTKMAFLRTKSFTRELCVQNVQGGEVRQLMRIPFALRGLDWAADGSAVVVAISKAFFQGAHLVRVPLDGSEPERLTIGEGATDVSIARTGARMAYERAQSIHDLWRVSGPEAVEPVPPARFPASSTRCESLPVYSPDGSRVAFSSDRHGGNEVWVSDADGRKLQVLSDHGHVKLGGWSPSGEYIGFAAYSQEENSLDVFVVKASGGIPVNLTPDETWDYAPSWTLDGRWVYYSCEREGKLQICRVLAEGGTPLQVTEEGGEVPRVVGDNELFFWREDGIWSLTLDELEETLVFGKELHFFGWNVWKGNIVYIDEVEDIDVIEMFDPKSGEPKRLYTFEEGTALGLGVAVSPDGQWILYTQVENRSDFMLVENFY